MRQNIVYGDPKAHLSTIKRTQSSTDVFGAVEQDELGVGGLDSSNSNNEVHICTIPR